MRFERLNQGALRGLLRSKSAFTVATSVSSSGSDTRETSYYREAKLLITGSPPPDDPRLGVIRQRALAALQGTSEPAGTEPDPRAKSK